MAKLENLASNSDMSGAMSFKSREIILSAHNMFTVQRSAAGSGHNHVAAAGEIMRCLCFVVKHITRLMFIIFDEEWKTLASLTCYEYTEIVNGPTTEN